MLKVSFRLILRTIRQKASEFLTKGSYKTLRTKQFVRAMGDLQSFTLVFTAFLLVVTLISIKRLTNRGPNLPPSPWRLPLIGNMHHLLGAPPHKALRELARKYGPVMLLKLGHIDHIIISSPEAARDIFKNHDVNFASRPQLVSPTIVLYNNQDIAFSPYGRYWRQLRKICTLELLSNPRVKSFSSIRESETSGLVQSIHTSAGNSPINLTEKLLIFVNALVSRTAFGSECKHGLRFTVELKKALDAMSGFEIADLFPSLGFLGYLFGTSRKLKQVSLNIDGILEDIIREHEVRNMAQEQSKEEDLVAVLLRIKDHGGLDFPLTMNNVKAVTTDMFSGGTETTSTTLVWAMAELMRHPEVMQKVQDEVRHVAKETGLIAEADMEKLHYMKLIIKETLRLHPPVPLLLPRTCQDMCNVGGFDIPAGSRVMINAWAIARDPRYWEDPESFRPERFEGSSVEFVDENFQYLPFGGGRRICPGIVYGMAVVETALANLLLHFEWQLPNRKEPMDLDMTEVAGLTLNLKSDLCLVATPRFPPP